MGYVVDKQYDAIEKAVHALLEEKHWRKPNVDPGKLMEQINILSGPVYEQSGRYLEWRHLSFCEYFAGMYLAEQMDSDCQRNEIAKVLDMIEAVKWAKQAKEDSPDHATESRSPADRWHWVFRFALCRAFANHDAGQTRTKQETQMPSTT